MNTGYGGNFVGSNDAYYLNRVGPVYENDFSMNNIFGNYSTKLNMLINRYLKGDELTEKEMKLME